MGAPAPINVTTQPQSSHPSPSGGGRPAPTNPLALLSPAQIVKQATNSIGKAYAPAYTDLNNQVTQAKALSDKRTADNKYYQAWLDTQGQALQTHADNAVYQLSAANNALLTQPPPASGQNFVGTPGSANAAYVGATESAQHDNLAAHVATANSNMGIGSAMVTATNANNVNVVQAGQQKQLAALNATLTGLGNARSKLEIGQAGATQKEIDRLQGVNMQIAQSNRNFAAVSAKLGLATANTQNQIQTRTANAQTSRMNANTSLSKAQFDQMNSDRKFQLDEKKYNLNVAKDLYQREHGLGPYKPSSTGAQRPLSLASQNAIYNHLGKIEVALKQLTAAGVTGPAAYRSIQRGWYQYTYTPKSTAANPHPKPVVARAKVTGEGDVQYLNAAYNLYTGNGLTAGDVAALKAHGLADPGSRLKVAASATAPTGAGGLGQRG